MNLAREVPDAAPPERSALVEPAGDAWRREWMFGEVADRSARVACTLVINIHHSFLPAFAGARPYERAKQCGVKLIGATAHYVTEDSTPARSSTRTSSASPTATTSPR